VTSQGQQTGTDDLERLFQRLVLNVAQLDPSRLDGPVPVVEIHQNLVPYRTHRAVLGIETNQDYEMAVLRLLAGEGGYAWVEPDEVRALLAREAASVNPETGVFRRFPSATVRLDPDRVRVLLGGGAKPAEEERPAPPAPTESPSTPHAAAAPVPPIASTTGRSEAAAPQRTPVAEPPFEIAAPATETPDAVVDAQPELPFSLEQESDDGVEPAGREIGTPGAQCSYCGGELPVGRSVIFCPHCGQNVGVMHCSVCGTELDVGWRFCITCGREMAGLG